VPKNERLDTAHAGLPRDFSGSRRCKMGPVPRQCDVRRLQMLT